MTNTPKLSIITVNLNNASGLRKTLDSVADQTFTNYEHIIMDGGSTEGSVEVIKAYEKQYNGIENGLYWLSEPDKGIYNAMNKGIKRAKGEYCLFLNSGDWLIEKTILNQIFEKFKNKDIVYCDIQTERGVLMYPDKLSLLTFFFHSIGHPASFIRRDIFQKIGMFSEELKIVSDWEFFIKAIIIQQCSYEHLPILLTFFNNDGVSSKRKFKTIENNEREKVLKHFFPLMYDDYLMLKKIKSDLKYYHDSRIIQFAEKFQKSKFYKFLRGE
ncbi:MAG: glycosyltransferase family 2 protein [Prolixibacteraceae bacterium]|jgi:glycosyltransferase involved in cell wall biosynthesis|nr:glycosyltransferase family 2 protein [Prolixibacteraceae bacterium]